MMEPAPVLLSQNFLSGHTTLAHDNIHRLAEVRLKSAIFRALDRTWAVP